MISVRCPVSENSLRLENPDEKLGQVVINRIQDQES